MYTGGLKGNHIFGFTAYGIFGLRLDSNQSKLYLLRHLQYPHFYFESRILILKIRLFFLLEFSIKTFLRPDEPKIVKGIIPHTIRDIASSFSHNWVSTLNRALTLNPTPSQSIEKCNFWSNYVIIINAHYCKCILMILVMYLQDKLVNYWIKNLEML